MRCLKSGNDSFYTNIFVNNCFNDESNIKNVMTQDKSSNNLTAEGKIVRITNLKCER